MGGEIGEFIFDFASEVAFLLPEPLFTPHPPIALIA